GHEIPKLVDFATGTLGADVKPTLVRQLTLNEVMGMPMTVSTSIYNDEFDPTTLDPKLQLTVAYPGGPLEILLNNTKWDHGSTETPAEGSTEVWEIVNFTADAHPIHLHLVQFQVLNRQKFDAGKYASTYAMSFPAACTPQDPMILGYCPGYGPPMDYDPATRPTKMVPGAGTTQFEYVGGNPDVTPFLQAQPQPASPQERGWKDTVMAPPGMVTRLVVRWSPTSAPVGATGADAAYPFSPASVGDSTYVWHCHIIDHEDNEMMRRSEVTPLADVPRDYVQNVDY
ncbi:MAG TPA: multicopper oxidase domain-containing protein, partial [Anaeromyxobacteraceae bacterium]|nr:multicopper oxidase domain-containing protein [Anaeromyxobacteraceae bacterium]